MVPTDRDLVERASAGDRFAYDALVERHYARIFGLLVARLGDRDAAEDISQEAFLRCWLHLTRLREGARFVSWVSQVAINLSVSEQRGAARRVRLAPMIPLGEEAMQAKDRGPNAAENLKQREAEKALLKALKHLPESERELVVSHFLQDVGQSDLATRSGVHQSTISRRLERALERLRELLGAESQKAVLQPPRGKAVALALVAGATKLPAAKLAELQAATVGEMSGGFTASLFSGTMAAKAAIGGLAMGATQKVLVGGVVVLALGGIAARHSMSPSEPTSQVPAARGIVGRGGLKPTADDRLVAVRGKELEFTLQPGRQVLVQSATAPPSGPNPLPSDNLFKTYEYLLDGKGSILIRMRRFDDTVAKFPMPLPKQEGANEYGLMNLHLWPEQERVSISCVQVSVRNGQVMLRQFNGESQTGAKELEAVQKAFQSGRVGKASAQEAIRQIAEKEGLVPQEPDFARTILQTLYGMAGS